jgi:hypothetical protein
MPDTNEKPYRFQWTQDLIDRHYDKILVMAGIVFFVMMSWWAYKNKEADFATACIDLAKQFVAAFLTLVASGAIANRRTNGGSNGSSTPTPTAQPSTPQPAAPVVAGK